MVSPLDMKSTLIELTDSTGKVVGGSSVSDGPFVEAKEVVGGFMIVQAASYEEAVVIAQEMPAGPGSRIEIRELAGAKM